MEISLLFRIRFVHPSLFKTIQGINPILPHTPPHTHTPIHAPHLPNHIPPYHQQLLDLFPEESGQKNKKQRIIPFLPGKKIITNKSSRELAEKRLPELAKYAKYVHTLILKDMCSL